MIARTVGLILVMASFVLETALAAGPRLDFQVNEGLNINSFLREGDVAAHLLLRSGNDPRILIAFPAGNSGVGLWFVHTPAAVSWVLDGRPEPLHDTDEGGRPLFGIAAKVSIAAGELKVRNAVLSSVRVLRDYQALGTVPARVEAAPVIQGNTLSWHRNRLDGAPGYRLEIQVTAGTLREGRLIAAADGKIGLLVRALSGETPLTPLSGLLNDRASQDPAARDTLTFLAYKQKYLAGSWRFDTYFGRDTLLSVRLLMPVLSVEAVEAGLSSVLARLSPQGEVAHEEDIGERAVLDHLEKDGTASAAAVFDYKMIDGNYLLAPIACDWLVEDQRARARAAAFLAAPARGPDERSGARGAALVDNLRLVLKTAAAFFKDPVAAHLISLKAGVPVGQWRDSEDGLGGGRFPYDVNVVMVPVALQAAARFLESGLLSPYLNAADRELFSHATEMAKVWQSKAPPLFAVVVPNKTAGTAIRAYAASTNIPSQPALEALGQSDLQFPALALDAAGKPIPVIHSDEGFDLLFGYPDPAQLEREVDTVIRPFPVGLMTDVGMVVASAVASPPALQSRFSRNAYHGAVVWSWQQAMFAAGLRRQLSRDDLPASVRSHLQTAEALLWKAITATRSVSNSELWSWSFADGRYKVAPFGAAAADADESNAAQLWSTVYLAVTPPQTRK